MKDVGRMWTIGEARNRMMREASLMKNMIAVVALCLCPSMLFSQLKPAQTTPSAKTKEGDTTVYGIHLGEKFSIPECKRLTDLSGKELQLYAGERSVVCFEWGPYMAPPDIKLNTPVVTHMVYILFPNAMPILYSMDMRGYAMDGNLERVFISTIGLKFQNYWLAQLKEKYGEPAVLKTVDKQNAPYILVVPSIGSPHTPRSLQIAPPMMEEPTPTRRAKPNQLCVVTIDIEIIPKLAFLPWPTDISPAGRYKKA